MRIRHFPTACGFPRTAAFSVFALCLAGCGGAKAPAPAPKAEVPALSVPVSALAVYLAERKERSEGKRKVELNAAQAEAGTERSERFARAVGRGTRLLAEGRHADAVAELAPAAAASELPPEKRAEALLALAEAYAGSGDAARAAEARKAFDEAMRKATEAHREAEARQRFTGLLLGHEITAKEGGDPESLFAPESSQ